MESNLNGAVAAAIDGNCFPQFLDTWQPSLNEAKQLARSMRAVSEGSRIRLALAIAEPEWFCAVLFAVAEIDCDLYLYNPNWGTKERLGADRLVDPHWIVEDRDFGGEKIEKPLASFDGHRDSIESRIMIPTGGSSGKIKFAVHSWQTLSVATHGLSQYLGAPAISSHCVLPLFHVSGFMQVIRAVLTGGKVVFGKATTFKSEHDMLFANCDYDRYVSLVPTQLERLLADEKAHPALRKYDAIFVGGSSIQESLLAQARELRLPIAPTYGMTETAAQVATLKPHRFLEGANGAGSALPHIAIEIVGENGGVAPSGSTGRIRIEGKSLCHGLLGQEAWDNGSYLTADIGVLDSDGSLSVIGRADRVIVSGGEKIDLGEIESELKRLGAISEVVAFGVEDAEWGSRLCVAYTPCGSDTSESELRRSLSRSLVNFKAPKTWLRLKALPRTEAGKIRLGELERMAKEM